MKVSKAIMAKFDKAVIRSGMNNEQVAKQIGMCNAQVGHLRNAKRKWVSVKTWNKMDGFIIDVGNQGTPTTRPYKKRIAAAAASSHTFNGETFYNAAYVAENSVVELR